MWSRVGLGKEKKVERAEARERIDWHLERIRVRESGAVTGRDGEACTLGFLKKELVSRKSVCR